MSRFFVLSRSLSKRDRPFSFPCQACFAIRTVLFYFLIIMISFNTMIHTLLFSFVLFTCASAVVMPPSASATMHIFFPTVLFPSFFF
jgi:hypothetical protein